MKVVKKTVAIVAAVVLLWAFPVSVGAEDGLDEMLPVRMAFESLGFSVDWDEEARSVGISADGITILLTIGNNTVHVEDLSFDLSTPPILVDSVTFAPVFEILHSLGVPLFDDVIVMEEVTPDEAAFLVSDFLRIFTTGNTDATFAMMSPEMRQLGSEFFSGIWQNIRMSIGSPVSFSVGEYEIVQGFIVFEAQLTHTTGIMPLSVVVDGWGDIAGLQSHAASFIPAPTGDNYISENILLGSNPWTLDGILTLPLDASPENPVPAIVLIHGSGPGNMDQSIFDNRPFFDIADYLSSNGIAVIRYNKRTYTHGAALMDTYGGAFTVVQETIEDAVLAANLLRSDPRIDPDNIFLAGISMGAMLAPRIQETWNNDFAGLILMAGSPRTLQEIIITQNMMSIEILDSAEQAAAMEQVTALIDLFDSFEGMSDQILQFVDLGGVSAYGLVEFASHPFAEIMERIDLPVLVLHGANDLQVPADIDFAALEALFEGRPDTELILYDGLNHIFMPSTAGNIGELFDEYARPARVSPQMLGDMVRWILER
jgi:pimeloyl-ACP methyl ester carboxylesterase